MEQKTDFAASQSQTPPKTGHETGAQITQSATNGPQTPQNTPKTTRKTASKRGKTSRAKATNKTRAKSAPKTGEKAAKNTSKPVAKKAVSEVQIYEGISAQTLGDGWGAEEQTPEEFEPVAKPLAVRRLPDNVKKFLVIRTACGESPSAVAKAAKEIFGIEVSASNVERYDPTKASGQTLCVELKTLFRRAQREYQAMVLRAGIADKRWRLQRLHFIAQNAIDRGNHVLAMQAMEQAAKEEGGQFTNKSVLQVDEKRSAMARLLQCRPEDLPVLQRVSEDVDKEKIH